MYLSAFFTKSCITKFHSDLQNAVDFPSFKKSADLSAVHRPLTVTEKILFVYVLGSILPLFLWTVHVQKLFGNSDLGYTKVRWEGNEWSLLPQ